MIAGFRNTTVLAALGFLTACSSPKTELLWTKTFYQIGSQSSPRMADLNNDGTLDIVMGAGRAEMDSIEQGVIALNGIDGSLLWQVGTPASVVGSATFLDITADGIDDVFIGGRNTFLAAINGSTGEFIWRYQVNETEHPIRKYARYNFYNATIVPDQNSDALPDLLIINGGNWDADPGSVSDREPGVLMVISSASGLILAADTMPDGKESYQSPIAFSQPGSDEIEIVFGSGGETISGALYHTTLTHLMREDLSKALVLARGIDHGFIAPPAIADVNEDGYFDILATSHGGEVMAIDGESKQQIWSTRFSGMESSNSFAVGLYNGDQVPDVCTVLSKGVWPFYSYSHQIMLDGKSGQIEYIDSSNCFSLSSPISTDLTGDGYDEVILSANRYDCTIQFGPDTLAPPEMANELMAIDFRSGSVQVIDHTDRFMNIFSTPWVGDLDGNGYLDIVYSQYYNPTDIRRFLGMQLKRISTSKRVPQTPKWSGYQGNDGRSVYKN